MEFGFDIIMLLMGVAFVAGAIDAIAGGGGMLTIPAMLAAGIPPVNALATNKLQSTFGTGGAVFAFARKGLIDVRSFARPIIASLLGSALGAWLLTQIAPDFLSALIPLLLITMAGYFLLAPKMTEEDRKGAGGPVTLLIIAATLGCYDGFFGPGTGSFLTTALVAIMGMGLTRAVAHTKLLNLASNIAALAVFIASGKIIWIIGFTMAIGSLAGGQLGAHLALRFGASAVRPLLVTICLALTVKLLADPENPLGLMVRGWLAG
ncbi:hypothetical protein DMP17_08645 [Pseudonocardia sp. TMWB2A]